ncbi:hypothetical protein HDU76_006886 [Blyttiomyces sp. JEL0837]|nr:hypothetical protein HDU76_006886 [Blyttiomyces sp. JEL0837]
MPGKYAGITSETIILCSESQNDKAARQDFEVQDAVNKRINKLQTKNLQLEKKVNELQESKESKTHQIQELLQVKTELEGHLAAASHKTNLVQHAYQQLTTSLNKSRNAVQALLMVKLDEIKNMEEQVRIHDAKMEEIQHDLRQEIRQKNDEVANLRSAKDSLELDFKAYAAAAAATEKALHDRTEELEAQRRLWEADQQRLKNVEDLLLVKGQEVAKLEQSIVAMNREKASIQDEVDQALEQLRSMEGKIGSLEVSLQLSETKVDSLNSLLSEKDSQIRMADEAIRGYQEEKSQLEEEVENSEARVRMVEEEKAKVEANLQLCETEHQRKVASLNEMLSESQRQIQKADEAIHFLKVEKVKSEEEFATRIRVVEEEKAKIEDELGNFKAELEKLGALLSKQGSTNKLVLENKIRDSDDQIRLVTHGKMKVEQELLDKSKSPKFENFELEKALEEERVRSKLAEQRADCAEKDKADLEVKLAEQAKLMDLEKLKVTEFETFLEAEKVKVASLELLIEEQRLGLKEAEEFKAKVLELENLVEDKKAKLKDLKKKVQVANWKGLELKNSVAQKDAELQDLEKKNQVAEVKVVELENLMKEKDSRLKVLEKNVAEEKAVVRQELREALEVAEQRAQAVEELKCELAQVKTLLSETQTKSLLLMRAKDRESSLKSEIVKLKKANDKLSEELKEIRSTLPISAGVRPSNGHSYGVKGSAYYYMGK